MAAFRRARTTAVNFSTARNRVTPSRSPRVGGGACHERLPPSHGPWTLVRGSIIDQFLPHPRQGLEQIPAANTKLPARRCQSHSLSEMSPKVRTTRQVAPRCTFGWRTAPITRSSDIRASLSHVCQPCPPHYNVFDGLTVSTGITDSNNRTPMHHVTYRNCTIRSLTSGASSRCLTMRSSSDAFSK